MREMKDSRIEWIGEIPDGWKISRIKQLFSEVNDRCENGENYTLLSVSEYYGVAPKSERISDDDMLTHAETLDGYKICKENDLVMNIMLAWKRALGVSKYTGIVSPAYCIYRGKQNMCAKYFHYLFRTDMYANLFKQYSTGIIDSRLRLYPDKFLALKCQVPPIDTQRRIADYLDRKCSQIDAIIARQQEAIEKLKAYKLSVITEAVTKGLNPDVPMKDSGVEWIGEIPKHWKMVRLKFLLSHIIDCPHETPIYSADGGYLVIRTADQDLGKLRADEDMYRLDEGEYYNRIRRMPLEKDDIVYGREGERWGLACLVPESNKYCLGQRMLQFRCKNELFLPRFAMWALNSKFVYLQGAVDTIGSTSPHVNISTVRNFLIPVPNINEQQEIIEYVDKQMSQLDQEVEHREMLICKLNEYKKSLIYEVVTGKKEV